MEKYKSQSNIKPQALDETSSPTTTYINKNITEIEVEMMDEKVKMFEYDVIQYTKDEYKLYKMQGNIDYIAMEMGVEI